MARRDLGAALGELGRVERDLESVADDLRACRDEMAGPAAPLAAALEANLSRRENRLKTRREGAAAAVEHVREVYLEHRRNLRALDRLFDMRRRAWQMESLAQEQREMDDAVRVRGHRRVAGVSP